MKATRLVPSLLAASIGVSCTATPRPSTPDGPPLPVAVGRAEVADLPSSLEAGGIVRARATAVLASRVMAPIGQVRVRPGDRVRRGATLVTLDAREIEANSARATAAVASAVAAARAAEADAQAAEAALQLARATHERINGLFGKGSATPQERDQTAAGLSGAEAQLAGAQARAAAARAARDAAQASAEAAEIGVSYTVLAAPFDGVITERTADPGSMAVPGAPLLTLEDSSVFRLEVQLDEARAAGIAVGQHVAVRLDDAAASDAWNDARVVEVARIDPASHSFLVKVDIPASATLRSGLFGRMRFAGPLVRHLTVPASAIVRRGQLTFVFAVDADGLARLRAITAGTDAGGRLEVLAGVRDGDLVVTDPSASLTDGTHVSAGAGSPRPQVTRVGDRR